MNVPETPELDKLSEVSEQSQTVYDFLEWLSDTKEFAVCELGTEHHSHSYFPVVQSRESLLAEFFGIDWAKVEDERRAILREYRASQ